MLSRQVKERLGDGRQRGGQQCGCVGSPPFGVGRRAAYGRTGPIVANRLSGSGRPSDVAMVEATDFANRDRPVRRALVDGQLLPQGEVLEGELAVAAAQEREESEQMEQEDDHRAKIFSESEQTDQPLAHRTEFWRRTAPETARCAPVTITVRAVYPNGGLKYPPSPVDNHGHCCDSVTTM